MAAPDAAFEFGGGGVNQIVLTVGGTKPPIKTMEYTSSRKIDDTTEEAFWLCECSTCGEVSTGVDVIDSARNELIQRKVIKNACNH